MRGKLKNPFLRGTKSDSSLLLFVDYTLTRIVKSVVTGQAPVTLEWENTPGKRTNQTKSGTYTHVDIIAEAIHASGSKNIKNEIGSHLTYVPCPYWYMRFSIRI